MLGQHNAVTWQPEAISVLGFGAPPRHQLKHSSNHTQPHDQKQQGSFSRHKADHERCLGHPLRRFRGRIFCLRRLHLLKASRKLRDLASCRNTAEPYQGSGLQGSGRKHDMNRCSVHDVILQSPLGKFPQIVGFHVEFAAGSNYVHQRGVPKQGWHSRILYWRGICGLFFVKPSFQQLKGSPTLKLQPIWNSSPLQSLAWIGVVSRSMPSYSLELLPMWLACTPPMVLGYQEIPNV